MTEQHRIKFIVNGHVQGVCYRYGAKQVADRLNINGYAKNLRNGDVEVVVCGYERSIVEFEKWLWIGPAMAEVSDVRKEIIDKKYFDALTLTNFEIY